MACHPVIERYVEDLSGRLPGPRRWRAAVLDEIRDSLLEGLDAHSDATDDPAVAALHAIHDHGPVDQIASAYAPELAAAWGRRTCLLALVLIPATAILWNAALRVGPPPPWHHFNTGLQIAEILIASGVCLTLVCSSAALLGTGRLVAFGSRHPLAVRSAITAATVAVTVAVLALLSVVAARAVTAPSSLNWPAVLTALTLSLTALGGLGHYTYRCLASNLVCRSPRLSS